MSNTAQRETNRRLNEAEAACLFPGFSAWRRRVLRLAAASKKEKA